MGGGATFPDPMESPDGKALRDYSHVLVTGGSSWLGRCVVRALAIGMPGLGVLGHGGQQVRCLVPDEAAAASLAGLGVSLVRGDVRRKADCDLFCEGAADGLLLHLAQRDESAGRIRLMRDINLTGTRRLLAASRRAGLRRMVLLSTGDAVGFSAYHDLSPEEAPPVKPYLTHGRLAAAREALLDGVPADGLETVVARVPWCYGPGQPGRLVGLMRRIKEGRVLYLGDGNNQVPLVHVDSALLGLLLCGFVPGAAGGRYWVADARSYPLARIVEAIRLAMQRDFGLRPPPRARHVPGALADGARTLEVLLEAFGLASARLRHWSELNLSGYCDIRPTRRDLGYEPLVDLREGMRRQVAWMLEQGLYL